ncbi:MAG: DUF4339 domain-containing protein [Victivallales bacterium]|nr:DUF4339 domain-containing protein [Victivallales bacterium]
MILFPCEHCGKVICTDDQSASQRVPCPYCQGMVVIPEESVVDCCLVYQDSSQPQGQPMSATELQEQLEAGNLNPSDLIWTKQAWRPLYQVLNMPLVVGDPQTEQPEVAIRFEEMPPMPGYAPLSKKGKRKKVAAKKSVITSAQAEPSEHVTIGQRIKKILFVIVALGVLFFGVVRGLRIYNYATKRLASVMVYNGLDRNVVYEFPFSGFEPEFIQCGSYAARENLVVGIPCKKSLKVWFHEGEEYFDASFTHGKKADQTMSVSIRPNHDTLVILGQIRFPIYRDFPVLCNSDQLAPQEKLKAATSELARNDAPRKIQALFEQAQQCLKEHLVEMHAGPVISDLEYNLVELNIEKGERPEVPPAPADDQRPFVVKPESFSYKFANGSFTISGEAKLEALTINLPVTTYHPPILGLAFNATAVTTLTPLENGGLRIEAILHQQRDEQLPKDYAGAWRYHAELASDGTWTWSWYFTPPDQTTLLIEADGKVSPMR